MILEIITKASQSKNKLTKISEKEYLAELTEPPERNRANRQLINLIAKEFNINPKKIKIKNPSSTRKIIKIIVD